MLAKLQHQVEEREEKKVHTTKNKESQKREKEKTIRRVRSRHYATSCHAPSPCDLEPFQKTTADNGYFVTLAIQLCWKSTGSRTASETVIGLFRVPVRPVAFELIPTPEGKPSDSRDSGFQATQGRLEWAPAWSFKLALTKTILRSWNSNYGRVFITRGGLFMPGKVGIFMLPLLFFFYPQPQ